MCDKTNSGYPDNSSCEFFVRNYFDWIYFKIIVSHRSENYVVWMNLSYNPGSNDLLTIVDEKGLNYVATEG